jgi:hypothetical protein
MAEGKKYVLIHHSSDSESLWNTVKNGSGLTAEEVGATETFRNPPQVWVSVGRFSLAGPQHAAMSLKSEFDHFRFQQGNGPSRSTMHLPGLARSGTGRLIYVKDGGWRLT